MPGEFEDLEVYRHARKLMSISFILLKGITGLATHFLKLVEKTNPGNKFGDLICPVIW